ncbi:MAG: hypothetical protein HLUCCA01_10295 [Bacteroidetes bacterium HLUCCA01]|nr:MAG: hypothetical protein HLUCCA01_10295 [Bacteroidetes bacterium HLUCCA01]
MTITDILLTRSHRPWPMPGGPWVYYQEWNEAVFLHWPVDASLVRPLVPAGLSLDLLDGSAWVSVVAFTMQRIRPRWVPAFPPVSTFPEINIRTYVRRNGLSGVYFLSIEAGNRVSCALARSLSGLPYRYSPMQRGSDYFRSNNPQPGDRLELRWQMGVPLVDKSPADVFLTERYALFQEHKQQLNTYQIHHVEWPVYEVNLQTLDVHYPRFGDLISDRPALTHYSPGVQVLAWSRSSEPLHRVR